MKIEKELNALLDAGQYTIDVAGGNCWTKSRSATCDRPISTGCAAWWIWKRSRRRSFKIVADPMHGSGSGYLTDILRGAGVKIEEIWRDRNPVFGGIKPGTDRAKSGATQRRRIGEQR